MLCPFRKANKAKFMPTIAYHMIAAFSLFNKHLAIRTPFKLCKILLKILITCSFMLMHHTILTKFSITFITNISLK